MVNGLTYTRKTTTVEATRQLASTLAPYLQPGDVILLSGDLGAGKTHFVQGLAEALDIHAPITSPTFNILLAYEAGRLPLYHMDLYRLEDESQLEDIGFYEILESGGVSCVEWADKFPDALPYDYLEIVVTVDSEGERHFRIHSVGSRSRQLLCVWSNDSKARLSKR